MTLRYSAWDGDVKQYTSKVLRYRICPDNWSYVKIGSEHLTPEELRLSWAPPPLRLRLGRLLDQFEQAANQPSPRDDTQSVNSHDHEDCDPLVAKSRGRSVSSE